MKTTYKNLPTLKTDAYLIGAGIMSTTLAILLKSAFPNKRITIVERLSEAGLESSDSFNNAGTGHAGYCELQYTPLENGIIEQTKAIKVNKAFSQSMELWTYLIANGCIKPEFLTRIPHYAFVTGEDNVKYLELRHETMKNTQGFEHITFTKDFDEIRKLLPLLTISRDKNYPIAVTKADNGVDVDFGRLTRELTCSLRMSGVSFRFGQEVVDVYRDGDEWSVIQKLRRNGQLIRVKTKFLFIGAGGGAITLLKKANIPEAKHYGGFPVAGQWLVCENPKIIEQHNGKVYTRPKKDSPQMVTEHMDLRVVNGQKKLLFGPYATLTTKFLKEGSSSDLFKSLRFDNVATMLEAGVRNLPLTKFLFNEAMKNKEDKFKVLRNMFPAANPDDWNLIDAGQRVQVIKRVNGKGVIEFGTEMVTSGDNTLACLLGASPGASTSANIMLRLIDKAFKPDEKAKARLKEMVPSYE